MNAGHTHRESANPRRAGHCDCGVALDKAKPNRDRRFEDDATRYLCSGLNFDPEPLNIYSCRRADRYRDKYGHDFPDLTRNMAREGADEAADARNYAVWWLDAYNRGLISDSEHWKAEHFQQALKYSALAFNEFHQAV